MSKTAILSVRIVSDAKNATKGFDNFAAKLDKVESRLTKFAGYGAAASAAIGALAAQSVAAASEMEQSSGAVEAVFKGQADQVKAWAEDSAQSVGLATSEYQNMATLIGSQLKNMGIDMDALAPKTNDLIGLGADLAATYGGTASEAVEALSSALRGEYDPIERYGIAIRKSDINARLAAKGMGDLEGEALRLAETETLLELVTEQSADAMGMFGREADTVAGQTQRAAAEWENAKAALGEALLPYVTRAAEEFAALAERIGENPQHFVRLAGAIVGVTGALFGVIGMIKLYRGAIAAFKGVQAIWSAVHNSMLLLSVRVWLISAAQAVASAARTVAAWVLARVQLAGIWLALAAQSVASGLASAAQWVAGAARSAAAWVVARAGMIAGWVMMGARAAASAAVAAGAWVANAARAAAAWVAPRLAMIAATAATTAMTVAQKLMNAVMAANPIGIVVTLIAALAAGLVLAYNKSETFRNGVNRLWDVAKRAFQGIYNAIQPVINAISNLVGWISNIRWPSPPAWLSNMFSAASPSFMGIPGQDSLLRFMSPPTMNMSATPDLTAARYSPSDASILGGFTGTGASSRGGVTVDNSITIQVDGSGIVDARAVADAIKRALRTDGVNRGLTVTGRRSRTVI